MIQSFLRLENSIKVALIIAIVCVVLILRILLSKVIGNLFMKRLQETTDKKNRNRLVNLLTIGTFLGVFHYGLITSTWFTDYRWLTIVAKVLLIVIVAILYQIFVTILKLVEAAYRYFPISKKQTIKPIIQIINFVGIGVAFMIIIGIIADTNPIGLIASATALTAVLSLIFKDIILAFYAGMFLSSSHIIELGDYIEVKSLNASGTVLDIGMSVVTLINTDNSTTTLPSYQLLINDIKNYRTIANLNGRQIKRTITIDASKIRTIEVRRIEPLRKKYHLDSESLINTNADLLIATISAYIKRHNSVNPESVIVSLGNQSLAGLELTIKASTKLSSLTEFEDFQSRLMSMIIFYVNHFELQQV